MDSSDTTRPVNVHISLYTQIRAFPGYEDVADLFLMRYLHTMNQKEMNGRLSAANSTERAKENATDLLESVYRGKTDGDFQDTNGTIKKTLLIVLSLLDDLEAARKV